MKLGKTALITVVAGIFVIAVASLGIAYFRQGQEQERLDEELALAQVRVKSYPIKQLSSQKEEMEIQMAEAESELSVTRASLRQSTESIEASDALFKIAETCQVEVTGINSSGLITETPEDVALSALAFAVTIEGDVPNLIDFVHRWTSAYPTGVVKSVVIKVSELSAEEIEAGEEVELKPSAIINVVIYNQEGG